MEEQKMKTIKKSLVWFVLALVITALLPIRLYSQETQADFSIIIFPDTQVMVEKYPAVYEMMCKWVVNNRDVYNIKAVLTVGDLVEAPIDIQFKTASAGYDLIDAARIPFMPISGTHDSDFMMGSQRSL
jgi:hypothetical protein